VSRVSRRVWVLFQDAASFEMQAVFRTEREALEAAGGQPERVAQQVLDFDKNADGCQSVSGEVWVIASKTGNGRYHPIHLCANQASARRLCDHGSQIYGPVHYAEPIDDALHRYLELSCQIGVDQGGSSTR
jgi:hypothetical protein